MKKLPLTAVFLLLFGVCVCAQEPIVSSCPAIRMTVPTNNLTGRDQGVFHVEVDPNENPDDLKFIWTVTGGRITWGNKTNAIEVSFKPGAKVVANVTIEGLPVGCENFASQTFPEENLTTSILLDEFRGSAAAMPNDRFKLIADTLIERPNDAIYVLTGRVNGKETGQSRERDSSLIKALVENGIPMDRIEIEHVYSEVAFTQIWRVPDGAQKPTCSECEELKERAKGCPSLEIDPPSNPWVAGGKDIYFGANLGEYPRPQNFTYLWEISDGAIVLGQNTSVIRVNTKKLHSTAITAKVVVKGLPKECINTANITIDVNLPDK